MRLKVKNKNEVNSIYEYRNKINFEGKIDHFNFKRLIRISHFINI
jgi:hypothetical protein